MLPNVLSMSDPQHRIVSMFEDDPPGSAIGSDGADTATASSPWVAPFEGLRTVAIDHESLSSRDLLELVAAWDQVEARAAAGKRAAAAALDERLGATVVHGLRQRVEITGQAANETAMRLGISRPAAASLVGEGDLFNGLLYDVGQSLERGEINAGKAGAFAHALSDQLPETCFAVIDQVLPLAPVQPRHQLEKTLQAVLVSADPSTAEQRHQQASRLRRLEPVQIRPDGMASMRLVAPLFDVATVFTYADATARATKAAGDERTMEQLRADALVALANSSLQPGNSVQPSNPEQPDRSISSSRSRSVPSLLPQDALETMSLEELASYERARLASEAGDPSELAQVRRMIGEIRGAQPATVRRRLHRGTLTTHDEPLERAPLVQPSGPASRLTLVLSRAHLKPSADDPPSPADHYRDEFYSQESNHRAISSERSEDSDSPEASSDVRDDQGPVAQPCPTVLGRDVPHLLGFGPIAPATARALIAEQAQRLTVTFHEDLEAEHVAWLAAAPESQHDPSTALERHMSSAFPTCIAPGCTVRSTSCDGDHLTSHPVGPTHICNLRPLCRRHHLLKTHGGHRIERSLHHNGGQILTWITPLGTRRVTQHERQSSKSAPSSKPTAPISGVSAPSLAGSNHAPPRWPDRPA